MIPAGGWDLRWQDERKERHGGLGMIRTSGLVSANRGGAKRGAAATSAGPRGVGRSGALLAAPWRGARRHALLASTALALVLAGPYAAKAQGIEDIDEVINQIIQIVHPAAQSNIASNLVVSQSNPLSTLIVDLNRADPDPIAIANNISIVTLPGEDGINGQSLGTAIVAIDVDVSQSNSNNYSDGSADQDQEVEQENENELDVAVDNAASGDTVSVANQANIVADGNGINALSQGVANVTVDNSVVQTNFNRLAGNASEELDQDQDVDQDNVNETDIEVLNEASASDVSVSNIGTTIATLNGINGASDADAETTIADTVSQTNTNELVGASTDLDQDQEVEQENENDQDAFADTSATSGYVTAVQIGTLTATNGTGIDAESKADADTEIDQTATQSNSNSATANVSLDVEDEEAAGEWEAEAELEQEQEEIDQSNDSEQEAGASASAAYVGDGAAVAVFQSGILNAPLGDGIDASSEAEAESEIDQTATQNNENSQTANLSGTASVTTNPNNLQEVELEVGVDVEQEQEDIDQSNDADQEAETSAEAYSGNVSVTQDLFSSITALGTGIEAESEASATADLDQTITQTNTNTQTLTTDFTFNVSPPFTGPAGTVELPSGAEGGAELEGEVEISQEQEDIEQENEAEQVGLEYPVLNAAGAIIGWENGPALAEAEAISGAVSVVQPVTSFLTAGDPLTGSGDGIDAATTAEADAELEQQAIQDNINRQTATTNLIFRAAPSFSSADTEVGDDVEIDAGIEEVEVELEQSQEDIDQSNEAEQDAVADADAGYEGFGYAVSVVQGGTLAAADTGIDAEARADADAELSQLADQGNENAQTATPTVAFTAEPTFNNIRIFPIEGTENQYDVEIDAGIEDVEVEVSQEQEDIEQENEADQDGAAYATADYAGDVYVEQSGILIAGDLLTGIGGDGIEAASVAEAEADLDQTAIQSNSNSQAINLLPFTPPATQTPTVAFTANASFTNVEIGATDDVEIEAGIEDVEVELEQEQEDIDQSNEAEQQGEAEAEAYAGDVYVEQTGALFAVEDGVKASSEAEADASLEQQADQDNLNAQSAATSLAFDASPTFGAAAGDATTVLPPNIDAREGGVILAAGDDIEIDAGIEDVEVSLEQEQEDIEQENEAEQEGDVDATAYSGDVTVNVGLDEVPVDPIAGDTGVDAASEADADAELEQLASQDNVNSQAATTTGSFSAAPTFEGVALVAGLQGNNDIEIAAGIEDVEVEVEQEQEDIDQSNDADQSGEVYAEAYSGYVDVLQRSGDLLTAGGDGIEAESRAEAEADLDQTALQSNTNSQTANTSLSFTANPTFGTETGPAFAGQDLFLEQILVPTAIATNGGVAISALDDVEIDAGIEDVEVELSQEQEDIDQSNEAEQRGLYYGEGEGWLLGPGAG